MVEKLTQESLVKAAMKYQDAVMTYVYGMLRDWSLAEDVFQDTLITIMKKWEEFRPGTNLCAWVRQIARYKTLETLRGHRSEMATEDQKLQEIVDRTFMSTLDENSAERHRVLMRALHDCLSGLNQQALKLLKGFYWETKSYRELADIHRRGVETIRKSLYRLRQYLSNCATRRVREREA